MTKGSMVSTFAYDYRHRLVKHTGYWQPWGGGGLNQSGTSWRLYDGDRIVLRSDIGAGFDQNAEYVWGRDLTGRHASGDGTGGLLMVRSNGINYVPRQDAQGNIWGFSGGYSRSLKASTQCVRLNLFSSIRCPTHGDHLSADWFGCFIPRRLFG